MQIIVWTLYDLWTLTMRIIGYIYSSTGPGSFSLIHGMEYIMHHPHEPIMYSRNQNLKINKSTHQWFFNERSTDIINNQEYYNFLHTYRDTYYARDISDRRFVTSTDHLFNGTIINWCAIKKSKTFRRSSNK